jgi:hypothetical protein
MKYEVFDIELGGDATQRIVNIVVEENSAVNFPVDMQNESYVKFLTEQGLTDKEVQSLKPGTWYEIQEPVSVQEEVAESVEEIIEDGTE